MPNSCQYFLIIAAALAALIAGTSAAAAQLYGLGTGKQGLYTYSAGAAIAKVASDSGLQLRVQPFGGTSAYIPALSAGEIQFGLANELETTYAVTGKVIYADKPQPDVRAVSVLTPLYSVLFVRKESDIRSIADLKGKRVPTDYLSQPVLDELTRGTLANAGLSYKDIQKVPVSNIAGGADEFADGKADVFMFALGAGKVSEVDARVGGLRVLPIDASLEAMTRVRKYIPVAYVTKVAPGKGRIGLHQPTQVIAYDYLILANRSVTDDAVYQLVKIMHSHKDSLVAGFRPLSGFEPSAMAKSLGSVRYHPGAIKFYKEVAQWPPKARS